jgi:hypothetical protein
MSQKTPHCRTSKSMKTESDIDHIALFQELLSVAVGKIPVLQ